MLLTIDGRRSEIATTSVFDCQLSPIGRLKAIEKYVSNYFLSTFVDNIDVFDCRISCVNSLYYGGHFCFAVRAATHYHTRAWQTLVYEKECFILLLSFSHFLNAVIVKGKHTHKFCLNYRIVLQRKNRCLPLLGIKNHKIVFCNAGTDQPALPRSLILNRTMEQWILVNFYIWASSRENLSSGFLTTQSQTSLRIPAV